MEEKREYYDLTSYQKVMYFALKYSPRKSIINIGASLWFEENIDTKLLEEAIYLAISRMDAMNLRLVKIGKVEKQYFSKEKPGKIQEVDCRNMTKEEVIKKMDKWTATSMKHKDCELYQFIILNLANDCTALYLKINHVIMDAWGLTVFTKDIIDIYCALQHHKELPSPPEPFLPILEKDLEYDTSERREKDFQFLKEKFEITPKFASINEKTIGKPYRLVSLRLKSKQKIYTLPKAKVDIIKDFCAKQRLSPQILFILASQCYFFMLNNQNESFIYNVVARRSTAARKKAGGMMINIMPLRIECPKNLTFLEGCNKLISEQLNSFRHSDFPFEYISDYIKTKHAKGNKRAIFTDLSLTYQLGKIDTEEELKFTTRPHSNGCSGVGVYLTIMDAADLGTLDFIFEYNIACCNEELVSKMYYEMLKVIELGIDSPESTLEEIMDKIKSKS